MAQPDWAPFVSVTNIVVNGIVTRLLASEMRTSFIYISLEHSLPLLRFALNRPVLFLYI